MVEIVFSNFNEENYNYNNNHYIFNDMSLSKFFEAILNLYTNEKIYFLLEVLY